jgi:hypothetical protein
VGEHSAGIIQTTRRKPCRFGRVYDLALFPAPALFRLRVEHCQPHRLLRLRQVAALAAIGDDALIRDCRKPSDSGHQDGSRAKVESAATELAANGYDGYSVSSLLQIRQTTAAFLKSRRLDLTFWLHADAGNPDMLPTRDAADREGSRHGSQDNRQRFAWGKFPKKWGNSPPPKPQARHASKSSNSRKAVTAAEADAAAKASTTRPRGIRPTISPSYGK